MTRKHPRETAESIPSVVPESIPSRTPRTAWTQFITSLSPEELKELLPLISGGASLDAAERRLREIRHNTTGLDARS
jgi:hypothetical protein